MQKEQNKRDLEASDIYKFAYIPTIDTLALMKSDSTIPLEEYWKSLASTSYKEKRADYIPRQQVELTFYAAKNSYWEFDLMPDLVISSRILTI